MRKVDKIEIRLAPRKAPEPKRQIQFSGTIRPRCAGIGKREKNLPPPGHPAANTTKDHWV